MVLRMTGHLGEKSKVISSGFKPTATEKEISRKILRKSKEKERAKIQGVTNLPPLKKSHPRDLVAQGTSMNILP